MRHGSAVNSVRFSPDGRLVPFCAYNLTDRQGRSLYRYKSETHPA